MESNNNKERKRKFKKNKVENIVDIIILPSIGKGNMSYIHFNRNIHNSFIILGTNTDYVIPRTEIEKTEEALNEIEREMSLKTY